MTAHRPGFSLVELLLVAVLGTVILGAAFQSLIIQERTYRVTSNAVVDHDALRTALGILESELREVNTSGGTAGLPDILTATRDSVVFRAPRGLGFVCALHPSAKKVDVWVMGAQDLLEENEAVVIFSDGADVQAFADDQWLIARISSVGSSSQSCPTRPGGGTADQFIELATLPGGPNVDGGFLSAGVLLGAPVRSLQRVTYGLYEFDGRWGLGRRIGENGDLERLIVGLEEPGEGLTFTYLDASGNTLTSNPVTNVSDIARIEIAARTLPRAGNAPLDLETTVFLRNN